MPPATLAIRIDISSGPPGLVKRYLVSCSYKPSGGGAKTACEGELGPHGGTLNGVVEADGNGQFPDAKVRITVEFLPETGLTAGQPKDMILKTSDGETRLLYQLPKTPNPKTVTVKFDFEAINPPNPVSTSSLELKGEHVVDGTVVRTLTDIPFKLVGKDASGNPAVAPADQSVSVAVDPFRPNEVRLTLFSPTGKVVDPAGGTAFAGNLTVVPLVHTVSAESNQTVLFQAVRDAAAHKLSFVAT